MAPESNRPHGSGAPARARGAGPAALLVGGAFGLLAAWFVLGPDNLDIPQQDPIVIDAAMLDTAPRRTALTDPPTIHIGGFDQTCMGCHRMFPPRENPPEQLLQHSHVRLNHGINDRCRNCHDDQDRDKLILRGGKRIPYAEVVDLCAQCHGPTYRDWQSGAHGRTNGYWDDGRGEVRRLGCTECHNPHDPRVPAMDPVVPLPGPRALRTDQEPPTDHAARGEIRDPLRRHGVGARAGSHDAHGAHGEDSAAEHDEEDPGE